MPELVLLPLLLGAGLLLGWLMLIFFLPVETTTEREPLDPLSYLFASLSLGLMVSGWLAFLLAEVGWFSIERLALLLLAFAGVLAFVGRKRFSRGLSVLRPGPATEQWSRLEYLLLAGWLLLASWLFLRPHEYILGGADAGVYVNTGVHVAAEGSLLIDDATVAELDPVLYPALLRERPSGEGTQYYLFPGFNIVDGGDGQIIPEFFHLHPVWQAVAFSLAGLQGTLLMPGLWALLGSLALYLAWRQLGGRTVALLVLLGLTFNTLEVWFARYPVTETLTQYLLWTGLWAFANWLSRHPPRAFWGLLAGMALGQLFLVRIDTLFLLAIPGLAGLWLLLSGRWQRTDLWFFVPVSLLTLHSFLHAYFISWPYFQRISNYVSLMLSRFWLIPLALLLFAILSLFLILRYRRQLPRLVAYRRPILGLATALLLLLVVYSWFIRPVYGTTSSYTEWYDGRTIVLTDRENLLRLGWYLSPVGIWLGAMGIAFLLWRLNLGTVALVATGLFFSLLYLWRIQANPHQIYAMRRYVPAVMPFFIGAAAYLLGWMARRQRWWRYLALLLAGVWLAGLTLSARGFISQIDNLGLTAQVAEMDEELAGPAVLIFNDQAEVSLGDLLGTPLHYVYGHDVFTLRRPEALDQAALRRQIDRWQAAGRTVYWVGDPAILEQEEWAYETGTFTFSFHFLEAVYDDKPRQLIPAEWLLSLHRIEESD